MNGLLLLIFSYVLIVIFLVTFFYKARKMAQLPIHLRWELSPVPHEKGRSHYGGSYLEEYDWWTKKRETSLVDEAKYMGKEIFFLNGVFENNKNLWFFSFPFHFGMYLLTAAAVFTFILALILPSESAGLGSYVEIVAASGFIIGASGTLGLIGRRLFDPNLRNYSSGGTLFNLFFLLALFGSGIIALFTVKDFYGEMMQYAKTLFFADTSGSISGIISLHCVITLLFLAYLPYTKMLHFLAKYFTYHEVRWNDKPMIADGRMEEDVKKLLSQPVTWAAPHLNADGKKNWVDIVSEEKKNEK
jgi:nitrate reductase gamma subunit